MIYSKRDLITASGGLNVQAFLRCIRHGETWQGEDAYRWLFGSTKSNPKLFDGWADHPRVRTYETYDGQFIKNGKLDFTTAAGAYQIVMSTWDPTADKYDLEDFSPKNQDIAACALIAGRGALEDVIAGRFETAIHKCRKEWASLPGAGYGDQPTKSLESLKAVYEEYGGAYDMAPPAATEQQELVPPNPFVKDDPVIVGPFIAAALPALLQTIPELVKIFGSGSDTSKRNAVAVEAVVGIAKDAIGAVNEQQLVEAITSDPEAAAKVREAVKSNWYELQEMGGGVKAAREAAVKMQGDKSVWHNPAMLISLVLLVFPMMLMIDVFYVHPDSYSNDGLRTQIVTGVMVVISMIGGFWLGTSFSSGKKDDAIIERATR